MNMQRSIHRRDRRVRRRLRDARATHRRRGRSCARSTSLAVALNPVDIAIGSGRFYAGHPPLPYLPGIECVGRPVGEQRLVYAQGSGMGIASDGFAAEQVAVPASALIDIPDDTDPAVAAALGTAGMAGWMSVTARGRAGRDDVVVVLGATGTVGRHRAPGGAAAAGSGGSSPSGATPNGWPSWAAWPTRPSRSTATTWPGASRPRAAGRRRS